MRGEALTSCRPFYPHDRMSYLEDLQQYLAPEAGVPGEDFFVSPPMPPTRKRGAENRIPQAATFISQARGAGENVKRYKNQAATSTPVVQIVIRDTDYLAGHEKAIATWRKLGPKITGPNAPTGYTGHVLQQSAPDFQGVNPDGMMLWAILLTLYIDYPSDELEE